MANTENNLSHLKVEDNKYPDLDLLFETQRELQKFLLKKRKYPTPDRLVTAVADDLMKHKHALDDEFSELLDAVGGINDGIGPAAWKWWKAAHKDNYHTLENMSDADRHELKMEYVDMIHFVVNIGLLLGMTGSEVMNFYLSKNAENIERKKRGY